MSLTSPSTLEKLEKLREGVEQWRGCLQCSMCSNIPNAFSKLLPCLHLLCAPCSRLQSSSSSTCCPVCDRECLGSDEEALDKANTFVEDKLIEVRIWERAIKFFDQLFSLSPERPIFCAFSACRSKETIAVFSCLNCYVHFCKACTETVHDGYFRAHSVIYTKKNPDIPNHKPLTMVHYNLPNPEDFPLCPKHPRSLRENFCLECRKMSCPTCLSEENHEGHDIFFFITPQYHQRFNFFNSIKELEDKQQSLEDHVAGIKAQVINTPNGLTISEDLRSLSLQETQLHKISKSLANTIKMSRFFFECGDNNQIGFLFSVATNQINHLQGQIKDLFLVGEARLISGQQDDNDNDVQAPSKDHGEAPISFLEGDRLSTWQQDLLSHSG